MSRSKIMSEEKIRIAIVCIGGTISLRAAARQLGVSQNVVSDWIRLYQTEGIETFISVKGNR